MPDRPNREHPERKLSEPESRPEATGEPEILSAPVETASAPAPPQEILSEAPVPEPPPAPALTPVMTEKIGEFGRPQTEGRFFQAKPGNNGTAEDDMIELFEKKRPAENRN